MANSQVTNFVDFLPIGRYLTLDQYMLSEEREFLLGYLEKYEYNHSRVARSIGISLRKVRYIVEKCGLITPFGGRTRPYKIGSTGSFSRRWPKLRMQALKLHRGRCHCCGATAKDGVRIHVDHVKPRSKFPELELDINNLQLLCEPCNLSKSNKDQTDWR